MGAEENISGDAREIPLQIIPPPHFARAVALGRSHCSFIGAQPIAGKLFFFAAARSVSR